LTPRLVQGQGAIANRDALRQLTRNSVIEAGAGAGILGIVAVLGTLPPGLHQQPTWPFSFRISGGVFNEPDLYIAMIFGAAWIAAGIVFRQFRWPAIAIGVAIYVMEGFRLPIIEAYPTTFDGSPNGFSTQSIANGEGVFAEQCASCHGPEGRGDGPAGASITIKPADLTADHVYAHTDGDLFWWISHGIDSGMPAFGELLDEDVRWNLINFIRANADATRLRIFGAKTIAAFPTPIFSARCQDGATFSIDQLRPQIVHIVIAGTGREDWLRQVISRDVADKLHTVVIASHPEATNDLELCTADEPETIKAFTLYSGTVPVEGTEFLVDPAGNLRSMWRADDSTDTRSAISLEQRVQDLRIAPRVQRPSSLQDHVHTH
jgi:mono/diheme cytochrome c family protein